MDKTIRLYIGGTTCVNCQNKIEKTLNHTVGIISASVSYNNATADIVYNEKTISLKEIITAIERLGYEVIRRKKATGPNIANTVCMLVIIVSLYVMLQSMGILNLLVPSQLADTKMGYGMLFVIGLITSVHCIAMCGGINLSQCIPQVTQGGIRQYQQAGYILSGSDLQYGTCSVLYSSRFRPCFGRLSDGWRY